MQSKLIFVHHYETSGCSGIDIIPFEYSRRDEFLYNIHERYKNIIWEKHTKVEVLGKFLSKLEFNDLEKDIYELEDWHDINKI